MGACYEIKPSGLVPAQSKGASCPADPMKAGKGFAPVVEVVTPQEFSALPLEELSDPEMLETLEEAESNFVDIYSKCIIGSFAVPLKDSTDLDTFAFYLDRQRLVFIDRDSTAAGVLQRIAQSGAIRTTTTAHCLYVFMKELLREDLAYMGKVEDQMEDLEEGLMEERVGISTPKIMRYRRISMRFVSYYQQLATMAAMLSDDENKMMSREEARRFDHMENLADRLAARAETLREYSLQLHELHQTHIDLKQNSTMQVFTIVTVLFAPLTLVTGWFGMNLASIPGLGFEGMWALLLTLFILCTAALLLFFRRKHWL